MFNKQNDNSKAGFDTLIGSNTIINGDLNSTGTVRVDGQVNGNIKIEGNIFIGESSTVVGDITASNVNIAGSVKGNVFTSGVLKLLQSCSLMGDVQVKSFVSEEGSRFEGNCKMTEMQGESNTIKSKKNDYKKSSAVDIHD